MRTPGTARKTVAMRLWELENNTLLEDFLSDHFASGGNRSSAAKAMGVNLPTLIQWLDRLGARLTYTVEFSDQPARELLASK